MPIHLNILALFIFIFGAYAYGSVILLALRHGPQIWAGHSGAEPCRLRQARRVSLWLYAVCTIWFVLQSVIEFRWLLGEPRNDDLIDLASLEVLFSFPALIFHTVLLETETEMPRPPSSRTGASVVLAFLYGSGLAMALYFPARIFGYVPGPRELGPSLGLSIGSLFTVASIASMVVMASRPRRAPTPDQHRLRLAMMGLFTLMIVVFSLLTFARERQLLLALLDVGVRMTPLAFLLVSVYFENRVQFYDLIIKRSVLLLLSLTAIGGVLALTLGLADELPADHTRPWIFALLLLPLAMALPWLHARVGRLLDRLWFGREFTPVEAIKHVLALMQQATDEASLVGAAESTLSEMFRRPVAILLDDQPAPEGAVVVDLRSPGSSAPVRLAIVSQPGGRPPLSEDLALLRSLGAVFGFMLDNVRLQRKRQEQEQVAHQLRLQTSRSELKALRAQINPHFLFNALNAIASLIHTDPARADLAVEQLAEVFRYTLRRSEQEWAPLDQELALARAYLDVEQARFGRRLEFAVDADPALGRAQVPSMLLQTLVENAVKHGISRIRTPGRIDVRADRRGDRLTLEVRDTGPGLEPPPRRPSAGGESFGLRSVRDRLQALFGEQAALSLVREAGQTVARLDLPLVEQSQALTGAAR